LLLLEVGEAALAVVLVLIMLVVVERVDLEPLLVHQVEAHLLSLL
jgi:hypothetical protein